MLKLYALIVVSFALIGCQGACTAEDVSLHPGIIISVVDSETGSFLCGLNVLVVDDDGYVEDRTSAADCVPAPPSERYGYAQGRAGTYQIVVSKEGYQTWEVEDFVVDQDLCSRPIARRLEVELVKL